MKSKTKAYGMRNKHKTAKRRIKNQLKLDSTRSLLDRMLDGMYRSTHAGKFVDVNTAFVEMFGYSSKQEMLDIPDIKKALYFSPEERGKHLLDTNQEEVKEYRMRRKDGSEIWVEDHGHYIHDDDGKIIFHEGILRNITERKRAEEKAATHLRELQQVLDSALPQIWYLDTEGRVVNCNRTAQKASGVTLDQAQGKTIRELAPNWDDPDRRHHESLTVARTGQPLLGSIESLHVDGETHWARVDKVPWRDVREEIIGVLMFIYDITDRKLSEERLQDSEARYRTLFDNANDPIYLIDLQGRFLDANDVACEQLGYTHEELLGMSLKDINLPEAAGTIPHQIRKVQELGRVVFESQHVRRDGSSFPVEISARAIYYQGQPVMLGVARNITERKRAEEALRDSEARYRAIFDNANDAFHFHDEDGRLLDVNEVACRRLGYRREELLKMTLKDVNAPEAAVLVPQRIKEIRERGHSVFEAREIRRDGSTFPVEVSVRPVFYKGKSAMLGISRDITERKLAEEASTRLAAIVESSEDAIVSKNLDGAITSWNRGAERLYGYSKDEIVGKHISILVPRNRPDDVKDILEKVKRGESVEHYETKRMRKDGTIIDVSLTVSAIKGRDGRTLGAATIARDITERKLMEDRLRFLHQHALRLALAKEVSETVGYTLDAMELTLGFENVEFWIVKDGSIHLEDSRGKRFKLTELQVNGPGVIAKAARMKNTVRVSDSRRESLFIDGYITNGGGEGVRMLSEVAVPVTVCNETVAVLNVENSRINRFSEHDQMLLETLASHVATALNRLNQQDELRRYSEHLEELVQARTKELQSVTEQLEYVLSANPAVVFIEKPSPDNSDLVSTFVSKSMSTVFGYEPEKLLYDSGLDFWTRHVYPEDLKRYRDQMKDLWRDDRHAFEYRFLQTDGTYRWIREEQKVTRGNRREVVDVVGVAMDITERKKLEEQLMNSQRLAAIGETAAMVGHDLRNPLQAMTSALFVAKELIQSAKEEEKREAVSLLSRMDEQVQYMDKIVSDLQNYSSPVKAEPIEVNLRELVLDVLSNANLPKGVETSLVVGEDAARAWLDPGLMRRIIVNLVTNAIQAMPDGGKLTVTSGKGKNMFSIAVQDTGAGMDTETLEHLFTPFFTKKSKGQGLGLAVCKRLADAQGGTITVESKLGKGSTFTVTIPTTGDV